MTGEHERGIVETIGRALRAVPAGTPGKTRLAHALLDGRIGAGHAHVRDRLGLSYRVPDLREPVAFHLLIDGAYEPDVLGVVLANLPAGGTFVDVGANVGVFSLPAARHVGREGRVVAIEASDTVYECLRANVGANGQSNVTPLHVAACDREGDVPFYAAPPDHFGMGSLAPQFHAEAATVPGARLDRLLAVQTITRVDVLKIDVEGFEVKVLEGATRLLQSDRPPIVVFEFCDWAEARVPGGRCGDAQRFLLDHGFTIWPVARFPRGRPLPNVQTAGSAMLVAALTGV